MNYHYYLTHYPLLLQKMGIRFSGDIKNTGFISSTVAFDSFDYASYITIGENTIISSEVQMLVHDYTIGNAMLALGAGGVKAGHLPHFLKEIKIGNNCFVGMRSIILPGTEIGDNTIIGAGSVVKGKIPANVIIAGNPAKVIKNIDDYVELHMKLHDYIDLLFRTGEYIEKSSSEFNYLYGWHDYNCSNKLFQHNNID